MSEARVIVSTRARTNEKSGAVEMARTAEAARELPDVEGYEALAQRHIHLANEIKALKKQQEEIRPQLLDLLVAEGEEDTEGHITALLGEEFEGFVGLMRQRRVSTPIDMEAAERILTNLGLWDRCNPPVPTLDEQEIKACYYEGVLTEALIDEMYPTKVTYALVPKRG